MLFQYGIEAEKGLKLTAYTSRFRAAILASFLSFWCDVLRAVEEGRRTNNDEGQLPNRASPDRTT